MNLKNTMKIWDSEEIEDEEKNPQKIWRKNKEMLGGAIWLEKNAGWSDEEEHQRRWAI